MSAVARGLLAVENCKLNATWSLPFGHTQRIWGKITTAQGLRAETEVWPWQGLTESNGRERQMKAYILPSLWSFPSHTFPFTWSWLRRDSPFPSNRISTERVQSSKLTVRQFGFTPERTKGALRHESWTSDMENLNNFFGGGFFALFKAQVWTLMDMLLSSSTEESKRMSCGNALCLARREPRVISESEN